MDLTLNGKVAMITGGSRGLGRQCALALGREGCAVAICGRDGETVEKTVSELAGLGVKANGSQADVTNPEDAERFFQETTVGPRRARHPGEQRGRPARLRPLRRDLDGTVP